MFVNQTHMGSLSVRYWKKPADRRADACQRHPVVWSWSHPSFYAIIKTRHMLGLVVWEPLSNLQNVNKVT